MLLREQKEFKVSPELTLQEFELSSFKDEHQEQLDGRLFLRLVRGKKRCLRHICLEV